MIQQHFIVELDHMDAKTADATLSILEAHHYSGVISAHSWDSPEENPRIYNLGGLRHPDRRRLAAVVHRPVEGEPARSATGASTTAPASATAPT